MQGYIAVARSTDKGAMPVAHLWKQALAGYQTQYLNLQGRIVVPGFIDSHVHFLSRGLQVYKFVENARAKGGNVSREPGPVKGRSSIIAFVKDPDGYAFEIIQRASTPEPLCQVMLRVGDLDRSINFYEKASYLM
ncbi:hypothetical protein POM88_046418 [Heracleum sosnowskyi]|uniref:VOC domain-containing protein n=1 Tax=Heracleum sosnowskyi TaxID=360622 RepID=A0AAD8H7M5_9APIA|nr:hypothetical protein POM88_046418 [Heracleum sosnowskyi]